MVNMKINLNDQNQCMKVFGKKQISVNQYITNENGKFAVIENSEGKFLIQKKIAIFGRQIKLTKKEYKEGHIQNINNLLNQFLQEIIILVNTVVNVVVI